MTATMPRADLIEVDKALESMRDAGFDLTAACGEPIDNSIEAGATTIRVLPVFSSNRRQIVSIGFADNGRGVDLEILPHVLRMGYSTRYGERKGLGRFGVGLKLAGLSVARRIEVYTRPVGTSRCYHTYIDLDEIAGGTQQYIEATEVDGWPADYRQLMESGSGRPFTHGTLVVWRTDRLKSGGSYGTSLEERVAELRTFLARAYRRYLDNPGFTIELGGRPVTLHDPLFLLDNPRLIDRYGREMRGRVIDRGTIPIDGHDVQVVVALAPRNLRPYEGAGGKVDADGKDIREFHINQDNSGRLSILRNGREIYYAIVPRLLPAGVDKIDRYIGIEVSFPAELDEYFQVRHVKRGAEPVKKLREELRKWLERPMQQARREIRSYWGQVKNREYQEAGAHNTVLDAVERAERTAPRGQAGLGMAPAETNRIVQELLHDLGLGSQSEPEKVAQVRKQIEERPAGLVDGAWPGKEMFEITHLNGKAIVRLNHRHPFIRDIYDPVKKVADNGTDDLTASDVAGLARKVEMAIDVLFLAYAKAENLHRDPSTFDDLRSYWGQQTQAYMRELLKEDD